MSKEEAAVLEVDGREIKVSSPSKLYFPKAGVTKLDLVRYYVAVAPGALLGIRNRPLVLKRFVDGAEGEPFYQKRAPANTPAWLRTVTLSFPSGRTAEELVVDDAAGLAWCANLGNIELHPHAVRADDLDHPDELRIDLDPGPGVAWDDVRRVALEVRALLEEHGLVGFPKTSGSRGMHVNVRIHPRWGFDQVRRAALAVAREIERRAPSLATSKWWKEERHGVFLDYNQNAKDRTTCSAYSVRPLPDARVSAPLSWDEVAACDPAEFTLFTMPARFTAVGDLHAGIDATAGSLEGLLELSARDEREGLGDAPWPPHYRKTEGEGARVAPSRAKKPATRKVAKAEGDAGPEGEGEARPEGEGEARPEGEAKPTKTRARRQAHPLLVIANSPKKDEALAGLERWKARHAEVAALLAVDDVLVDSMRGRSSTWTRVRVNLRNVPEAQRPAQEKPDPDEDPTAAWRKARGVAGGGESE